MSLLSFLRFLNDLFLKRISDRRLFVSKICNGNYTDLICVASGDHLSLQDDTEEFSLNQPRSYSFHIDCIAYGDDERTLRFIYSFTGSVDSSVVDSLKEEEIEPWLYVAYFECKKFEEEMDYSNVRVLLHQRKGLQHTPVDPEKLEALEKLSQEVIFNEGEML